MKLQFKILFAVVSFLVVFFIDRQQIFIWETELQIELALEADLSQLRLQNAVNQRIKCTSYLKLMIELHPDTSPEEFGLFSDKLMMFNPSIRALQIADRDTRVIYVYPPKGNEITIEAPMLLIEDPERGAYVRKAIQTRQMTVQPPFELRQGGLGIVARNPIFIDGLFSGLAIAVLDVSEILKNVLNQTDTSQFSMTLIDSDGREFFTNSSKIEFFEERIISLGDTYWVVKISSIGPGENMPFSHRFGMSIAVAGVLIILFLIIQMLLNRSVRLSHEVLKKTKELSDSDTRFLSVIENTGAGYFQIGNDGLYRDVNKAWLEMHGYRSKDEILGKHFSITQAAEDVASAERNVELLLNGNSVPMGEFARLKKDGTVGYHTYTARPFFIDGEICGLEGFIFDITNRISAERNKDLMMKELNHRVKNNLMIVSSLLKLKDISLGETADLSDVSHQIDAIQLLHEKLYKTGEVSRIAVRDYLEDLFQTIFSSFTNKEVEIRSNIEDVYFNVKTAVAIGLIANEVSTNSIKHAFRGNDDYWFAVTLTLDKDNRQYVLNLSNNGESIAEEVSLNNTGTFGMRLISTLVKQLGGSIELQKHPETAFTIRFPESIASD